MSWRERPYTQEDDYRGSFGGGGPPSRGGFSSWLGGMPAPGRTVKWLLIANVGMFVLCKLTGGDNGIIYRSLAMYVEDVTHRFQIWRLLTFSYLHDQASLFHILFNMIGLYFLGMPLERRWGSLRLFVFYTVASLVGVSLYVALSLIGWLPARVLGVPVSLIGASGGVLAMLGACAVLFPSFQIIFVFFPVPIRLASLIFVIMYSWNLFERGQNAGGDACHLAGLAFGIYMGYDGERWFGFLDTWRQRREARNRREIYEKAAAAERRIDAILDKVREKGIGSLTRAEKRELEEATRARQ
ncbi:MAG: rhomboid family intramembrane serine protease [Phycisphaerae bacterium]|nr:rhomboid family intramembrane serine protease [Phycisphaerae bacterium]